jgi:hypothetical protein
MHADPQCSLAPDGPAVLGNVMRFCGYLLCPSACPNYKSARWTKHAGSCATLRRVWCLRSRRFFFSLLSIENGPLSDFSKRLLELKDDAGAGLAVALFLASGGIGYLFSVIHHWSHWRFNCKWLSAIDHTRIIKRLSEEGLLELKRLDGFEVDIDAIDRRSAWVILTAVWKEISEMNLKFSPRIVVRRGSQTSCIPPELPG